MANRIQSEGSRNARRHFERGRLFVLVVLSAAPWVASACTDGGGETTNDGEQAGSAGSAGSVDASGGAGFGGSGGSAMAGGGASLGQAGTSGGSASDGGASGASGGSEGGGVASGGSGGSGGASGNGSAPGGVGGAGGAAACPAEASTTCGDGIRNPTTEECDDGNTIDTDACSNDCHVRDLLTAPTGVGGSNPGIGGSSGSAGASPAVLGHVLGNSPHHAATASDASAIALSDATAFSLAVATFGPHGEPTAIWSDISLPASDIQSPNPSIAQLTPTTFALAWTDFNGDGDETGIALRIINPSTGPVGAISHANATTDFSQYDPDILSLPNGGVAVAWTDASDIGTGPDVRIRTFDANLQPTSGELTLAATPDVESDVVLGSFSDSWAAAWRVASNGMESAVVALPDGTSWTTGPYVSAPNDDRPSLVEIDSSHLLLVLTEGVDLDGDGLADGSALSYAILPTSAPGPVVSQSLAPVDPLGLGATAWQSHPTAIGSGTDIYVSWRSAAVLNSARGEDVWLARVVVNLGQGTVGINSSDAEIPIPRLLAHDQGDQRHPGLASASVCGASALVAVWEDWSQTLGPGEGEPDVVFELLPEPILRIGGGS